MLAAIVIFAAAAAVAVVQATGSDDSGEPNALQATSVGPADEIGESQQAASAEPNGTETAQPIQQTQSVEQSTEPQQPVSEAEAQAEQADEEEIAPEPEADNPLRGFVIPIAGACITEFPGHLPGSTRHYRNDGVHEGLDFYEWASCTAVRYSTEILAAKAGVVIRADLNYIDITPADWDRFIAANWEGEEILDELRGRQVWIDHGRGIVSRYAHLSAIAEGIAAGTEVRRGQVIGYPGESGQQEVYANPGTDVHLHFEIRVGDGWLGQGETLEAARRLYLQAFGLAD
ncbi:MAG: M23 family metallopeptidase [Chloroflexota bacterium]|nr:M23 family metallopeptidase [Chloroflexota bacterium]